MKFLTPTVKAEYFARAPTEAVAKLKTELSQGRAHSGSHVYHDMAAHELARFGFRGEIRVLAPRSTKAGRVAFLQLAPCPVRCFVNTEHLMRLVAKDLKHGELRIYIPMALNSPLVDAWCVCTIDEKRMVVGLQMPVAKLKHPRAEVVAKEHFNAIHGAFGTHGVSVHKAAWVVSVLPSAHSAKFPYQHAKADVWGIWPHTQAKLAMPLDEQGKPPATVAAMRDMRAEGTGVELSAAVTAGDLCMLYHMGPKRASQLLAVLHDNTRDESKTVEGFLDSLENSHKTLARVLKHERNRGRWAYHAQVWAGSAPAPDTTRTAVRPKRRVEADGTAGGHSHHSGHTKRARRGKLKAERAWQTNNSRLLLVPGV